MPTVAIIQCMKWWSVLFISFNFIQHFLTWDFSSRRLCLACSGDRQHRADRWFLSVAVNRPLVGGLTPVTLLVCNSGVPSHSLGQLRSVSQKCDEQVVAVQLGCGQMCSASSPVPAAVYGCMGENLAHQWEIVKYPPSPIHWTSAPAAVRQILVIIEMSQQEEKKTYQCRGQQRRPGKLIG